MIVNLYRHRGYIWRTAWADMRNRYVGSAMGFVWNILQPLSLILIFTLVFTNVFPDRSAALGVPGGYTIYLCAALLPWLAFADCVNRGTHAFVLNATYLRKLPIPEQVFVAQAALSTAFGLVISYALLVVVALGLGFGPSWHWLLLPVPMALLIGLGFGLGMMLGTVFAFIRDVGQLVPILIQIGFWSFPIVYEERVLPQWMRTAIRFNPVYPHLSACRGLFLDRELPGPWVWAGMVAWTAGASIVGYLVLRRLRPELRDVI